MVHGITSKTLPQVYEVTEECSKGNKNKSEVEIRCTHQDKNDKIYILLQYMQKDTIRWFTLGNLKRFWCKWLKITCSLFKETPEYTKTNMNHASILPPTLMWCHRVIVLHIIRRRRLTVTTTQVKAIVLTSQRPNIFPAEFMALVLEATTK